MVPRGRAIRYTIDRMRVEIRKISTCSIFLTLFVAQVAEASPYPYRFPCPIVGAEVSASQNGEAKDWAPVLTARAAFTQVEIFMMPYAWWGAYGRGQYNLRTDAIQTAVGVGAGFFGLGLEAGAVAQKKGQNYDIGGEFTALLSVGYVGFFSRLTLFRNEPKTADFGIRLNYLFTEFGS